MMLGRTIIDTLSLCLFFTYLYSVSNKMFGLCAMFKQLEPGCICEYLCKNNANTSLSLLKHSAISESFVATDFDICEKLLLY